jgi:hypothetical protein
LTDAEFLAYRPQNWPTGKILKRAIDVDALAPEIEASAG